MPGVSRPDGPRPMQQSLLVWPVSAGRRSSRMTLLGLFLSVSVSMFVQPRERFASRTSRNRPMRAGGGMFVAVANRRGSRVVAAVERVLGLLVAAAAVVLVWGYGAGRHIRPRGPPSLVCIRTASLLQRERHHEPGRFQIAGRFGGSVDAEGSESIFKVGRDRPLSKACRLRRWSREAQKPSWP